MSTVTRGRNVYTNGMEQPTKKHTLIALMCLTFILAPLAIFAEDRAALIWNSQLYAPPYQDEVSFHTPTITNGTFLPPTITTSKTYTAADNPLLLTYQTTIPAGITVTLEPGVRVYAHEFATLTVNGHLATSGTPEEPIIFTTNEAHPDNQNWNGLVINPGGRVTATHTTIEYASPAISCMKNSQLVAKNLHTTFGLVGLYTESPTCTLTNSRLQALHYGVVTHNAQPPLTNTSISAGKEPIRNTSY